MWDATVEEERRDQRGTSQLAYHAERHRYVTMYKPLPPAEEKCRSNRQRIEQTTASRYQSPICPHKHMYKPTGACTINRPLITMHDWDLPTYFCAHGRLYGHAPVVVCHGVMACDDYTLTAGQPYRILRDLYIPTNQYILRTDKQTDTHTDTTRNDMVLPYIRPCI